MTAEELRQGAGFDEPRGRLPFKVFRAFADLTLRAHGDVFLANNMLDSLATLIPPRSREGGLLLSQRAAASWYLGDNELALERYRQLTRLGKALGELELVARGLDGVAAVRMSAGNLPEAERQIRRALRYAGKSLPRASGQTTLRLAIIHATRGDFDAALDHAWRAYQLVERFERDRRAVLVNIAQILYDAGHPDASRAAATHLLRLPLVHQELFAVLGTHARSSAAVGDTRGADWSVAQVLRLAQQPSFPQYVADALLECSFALDELGRPEKANRCRARAQELAVRHGYHDIAYLAEHAIPRGKPRTRPRSSPATLAIVTEVQALDPGKLTLAEIHAG